MKKGFQLLKKKWSKIRAFVMIVCIGLQLTSCCSQKEIVQPTIKIVETHRIDTCFVVKSDTVLCFETDTLRVETIVRDTILRLKVETKPIIVRDTSLIEKEKAKIKKEKAKENPKKTKTFLTFLMCFILLFFLLYIKKK